MNGLTSSIIRCYQQRAPLDVQILTITAPYEDDPISRRALAANAKIGDPT